jgi:exopolysaccharide biosynthesis polyprenyl glycosylphosphotransferase
VLREHDHALRYASISLDLLVTVAALWTAALLRDHVIGPYLAPGIVRGQMDFGSMVPLFLALPPLLVFLLRAQGQYDSLRTARMRDALPPILIAVLSSAAAGMILGFILDSNNTNRAGVSRLVLILFSGVGFAALGAKHLLVRRFLHRIRMKGYNWRTLALVGKESDIQELTRQISASPHWGFRVVAVCPTDPSRDSSGTRENPPLWGADISLVSNTEELVQYLRTAPVDEVLQLSHDEPLSTHATLFEACEEMGIRTRLAVRFFRNAIAKPRLDHFDSLPLVTWSPAPDGSASLLMKQLFDRVVSLVLLVLCLPILFITAMLVKMTSASWRDPILFGQTRCGLNGRLFTMWKFRTMVVNADALVANLKNQNEMGGPVFKIKQDPRITPVGRWLRRLSIDELPQLYNVLIGDMSLVGPRPPLPREVALYDRWQRRRLSMKPGITCLWQVSGRNNLPFETWMKLDLEYIDNWSLWLDIKILFRTVYAVTTGHGAM